MNGYIKIHRKILEWEWYSDINTFKLFLHLLLCANYSDKKWQGLTINAGQFITTLDDLAFKNKLSIQEIRTSLKKLALTGEINTRKTRNKTLITLVNYGSYQDIILEKQQTINTRLTDEQHTINRRLTDEQHTINTPIIVEQNKQKKERKTVSLSGAKTEIAEAVKNPLWQYAISISSKRTNLTTTPERYAIGILKQWKKDGHKTKNDLLDAGIISKANHTDDSSFDLDSLDKQIMEGYGKGVI